MRVDPFLESVAATAGRLVARAASADGQRTPLSWTVDVFLVSAADELEKRGIPRAVAADMFGVSRRTLIRRLNTSRETIGYRRRTLWSRVRQTLLAKPGITQEALAALFPGQREESLTIARDMVTTGWATDHKGRLRAVPDAEITLEDVVSMLQSWWLTAPEPTAGAGQIAEAFGLPTEMVSKAMLVAKPSVKIDQTSSNRWRMLSVVVGVVERFLSAKVDGLEEKSHGGAWGVRIDHLDPSVESRLRGTVEKARAAVSQVVGEVSSMGHTPEQPGRRLWTAVFLDVVD